MFGRGLIRRLVFFFAFWFIFQINGWLDWNDCQHGTLLSAVLE